MASPQDTLMWRLRQDAAGMTRSERRVARTLLRTNLRAARGTLATLAGEADVSAPSVLRFISRLGFEGFSAFQQAVENEFAQRISSPAMQLSSRTMTGMDASAFLSEAHRQVVASIDATFEAISAKDFDRAAGLLRNPKRNIYILGGRFSRLFAEYLTWRLYQLRIDVRSAGATSLVLTKEEELPEIGRSTILVAFDFRRYQTDVIEFARTAVEQGALLIVITDTWMSPMVDFASVVLPVHIEAPWGQDSFANGAMLIELLFGRVLSECDDDAFSRMRVLEGHQRGMLD